MNEKISNSTLANILVKIFKKYQISNICISPGSRNAPLIKEFSSEKNFKLYSQIDERTSGFFGLGISKNTNNPTVIVTTSGTAVANLLPSVIEADLSMTPLIFLTADRPQKLVNTGENQTILQNGIFNNFIRKELHIDSNIKSLKILNQKINETINSSLGVNKHNAPGPVHINIAFDEPLIDNKKNVKIDIELIKNKIKSKKILLPKFSRPLIVCGQLNSAKYFNKIIKLSENIDAPVLADPVSNIRLWKKHKNIVSYYNHFLKFLNQSPDIILRFGKKPTSKKLNELLKNMRNKTYLFAKHKKYNDDVENIININDSITNNNVNSNWLNHVLDLNKKTELFLNKNLNKIFFEGNIINSIINNLDNKDNLFVGNSMVVRNVEKYSPNLNKKIKIHSNRGASGIDGIIASALGMAVSDGTKRNILILGDVSFFYDIGSLILNKNNVNLTIIIINNQGGQIFKTLGYENKINNFDDLLLTKINVPIKEIAKICKSNYFHFKSINQINKKLNEVVNMIGIQIIEIGCDFDTTIEFEKKINKDLVI